MLERQHILTSSVHWEGLSLGQEVHVLLQALTGLCAPTQPASAVQGFVFLYQGPAPTTTQASDLVRGVGCRICHLGPLERLWGLRADGDAQAGALEEQDPGLL